MIMKDNLLCYLYICVPVNSAIVYLYIPILMISSKFQNRQLASSRFIRMATFFYVPIRRWFRFFKNRAQRHVRVIELVQ